MLSARLATTVHEEVDCTADSWSHTALHIFELARIVSGLSQIAATISRVSSNGREASRTGRPGTEVRFEIKGETHACNAGLHVSASSWVQIDDDSTQKYSADFYTLVQSKEALHT
jgi:hypothetical protein